MTEDREKYLKRLEELLFELNMRQEIAFQFRDKKPGYFEGYSDAINELFLDIKGIKVLLDAIMKEQK